jgi:hypothetical protein
MDATEAPSTVNEQKAAATANKALRIMIFLLSRGRRQAARATGSSAFSGSEETAPPSVVREIIAAARARTVLRNMFFLPFAQGFIARGRFGSSRGGAGHPEQRLERGCPACFQILPRFPGAVRLC